MSNERDDSLSNVRAAGTVIYTGHECGDAADWRDAEEKSAQLNKNHG
ncbi:hypothetical protein [Streptomyces cacaoi]